MVKIIATTFVLRLLQSNWHNFLCVSGKTFCQNCKKKCSGEVLRVQDKYFHINCFKCQGKLHSVAPGGMTFTLSSKRHNTSVLVFTALRKMRS